ncbi:MAG: NAD(P)/FAD-dependent oxidoreductase [Actinomycetota bacterium]
MADRPHVVIIGAGFGGLAAAKALAGAEVDITVVDQRNHHTFQPLLYQVATAGLGVDDICYATRGIFHRQGNARAVQGRLTGLDLDARLVHLAHGRPLPYDHLVLALGAVTADYGVPGVAEHAFGLKNAEEARGIRSHVLARFEAADRTTDPSARAAAMTVVVAGGGPTGVEMAGGFAELFHRVLDRDFPDLDLTNARVVLVEGQDRVLGTFSPKLGRKAQRTLENMGVEVRTGVNVERFEPGEVALADGTSIAADTLVWAAGVRAHPIAAALGLETGRGGRVVVDEHLRLSDHPEVFVIGDLAAATLDDGSLVPQVAPGAIQGGEHAAAVITGEHSGPFRYEDKGSMATIGRNAAVVEFPSGRTISGFLGWATWLALHLYMLIGFRNRANVLVNWAWNYLTYDRGSRLIVEPDGPLDEPSLNRPR